MTIEENVPLSTLTTFKTGGPARFLVSIESEAELREAARFAKEKGLPLIPLGEGSNICAPDDGVIAVFVRSHMKEISATSAGEEILLTADAGANWDELVSRAVGEGWWGIENLSGIPGSVGASVVQNIGAYGAAVGEHVERVFAFDFEAMALRELSKSECAFEYRSSIFKKEAGRFFILRVVFGLSKKGRPNLSYRDLKNRFGEQASPALGDVREAVIEIRKGKFPPLSTFGTAGSFFLNPIVAEQDVPAIRAQYPEMPLFPMPEGGVKVPAAWLFDHVLNLKGLRRGNAFVWEKQPLVIAAESGATSADVCALAEEIMRMMEAKTGIILTPEVRLLSSEKKKN